MVTLANLACFSELWGAPRMGGPCCLPPPGFQAFLPRSLLGAPVRKEALSVALPGASEVPAAVPKSLSNAGALKPDLSPSPSHSWAGGSLAAGGGAQGTRSLLESIRENREMSAE